MFFPTLPSERGGATASIRNDQSGQALMAWVMIMVMLFAGLMSASSAYGLTAIKATRESRDFVIAGQLTNEAIQNAVYQFNAGAIATDGTLPPVTGSSNTLCGSTMSDAILRGGAWDTTKLGCGVYQSAPNTGKWQWTVEDTSLGGANPSAIGTRYKVTATGAYGKAERSVTVNLSASSVTGVRYDAQNKIGYTVTPSTVFDYAIFGGGDGPGEGMSWAKGVKPTSDVYIKGQVGSNNLVDISKTTDSNDTSVSSKYDVPAVAFYNYGGADGWDLRCNTTTAINMSKSACEPIVRAPQKMVLNSDFVDSLSTKCVGVPTKWVASENAGFIDAGLGNVGCYTEMVFDRDTTIVGTSFFSAFVSGDITINPGVNITSLGAASLVIYGGGNVSLSNGGGNTLKELDMFVYAPRGTCDLTNTQADVSPVKVVGSLACNKVALEGVSVEWKAVSPGVDQPGATTSTSSAKKLWNADSAVEGPSSRLS